MVYTQIKYGNLVIWLTMGVVGLLLVSCTTTPSTQTDDRATVVLTDTALTTQTPLSVTSDAATITPPPHEDARLDIMCAVGEAEPVPCENLVELSLGDTLRISTHPVSIGLIRYTLGSADSDIQITYDPRSGEAATVTDTNPVLDSSAVNRLEGDSAEFAFAAVGSGSTSIFINASGEISDFMYHDGQWQPVFSWGAVSSQPLEITVIP